MFKITGLFAAALVFWTMSAVAQEVEKHALSLIGDPEYGPDATHLDWVNPDAPKGGTLKQAIRGTFDNLHPFALKGNLASGIGLTLQSLMSTHAGETSTEYPSIARSVSVADDLSYVRFNLNPAARFHDGSAITTDDVIFSFNALTGEASLPQYRRYYANVDRAESTGDAQVTFYFTGPPNRELPQIVGQLPVFSKAYWQDKNFSSTTLEIPVGAGPYRITSFEPGRYIEYQRVENWWAADLFVNKGQYNFDVIRYDYYKDDNALRLAFQKGLSDFRQENTALHWAKSYDFPAVRDGRVIKTEIVDKSPQGMQAFVMNTRREIFKDRRVREAISLAFDFEWTNKERFFQTYRRTKSFFQNSVFEARGVPGEAELKLLEPLKEHVPAELFTQEFSLPETDGSGRNRQQLRQAKRLLEASGWQVADDGVLRDTQGRAFEMEVMLITPAFERLVGPYLQNLRKLGIQGRMIVLQQAEYIARIRAFEYDMFVTTWRQSNSPGNEQRNMWGSLAADEPNSRNYAGIRNPAIDALIEHVVTAENREQLIVATRALDRALLWGYYVVPQWHTPTFRVAYWDKFGRPDKSPDYDVGLMSWWIDPVKQQNLDLKGTE